MPRCSKWECQLTSLNGVPEFLSRSAKGLVVDGLADTRCVFVRGARQVGKSTLTKQIAESEHPAHVISLDTKAARDAALSDPEGFVAGLERPVLIDEVQRGGSDLLLAIKAAVDEDESPGQFLLTGSADVLRNKKVSDALTGRIEVITLWPLAQAEIESSASNFVDAVFAGQPPSVSRAPKGRDALRERVSAGGYPEARLRLGRRRARWYDSYLATTFEKDLETITDAHKLHEIPRLIRILAAQAANLFVPSSIGSKLGLDHRTIQSYVGLLETIFLIRRIPAWRPNFGQREVQTAKAYVVDSGLLLHLLGADEDRFLADDQLTGKALENFVAMEVLRHAEWSECSPRLYHYRRGRDEVDIVAEDRAGRVVAIEVKASASVSAGDWRVLAKLRDKVGSSFQCGVVIHTGDQTTPLGDRLFAVPLSGLWASG